MATAKSYRQKKKQQKCITRLFFLAADRAANPPHPFHTKKREKKGTKKNSRSNLDDDGRIETYSKWKEKVG